MFNWQNRLRSKAAWVAFLSPIVLVAKVYFRYEIPQADMQINLILSILTGLGVWNNPNTPKTF